MNFSKRAFLYVSRKKGKTLSLFLLIFIVAVFLISCFGVLNASERLSKDIRSSLGAVFYIRANTTVSTNENGETEVRKNSVNISQKAIDEIMKAGDIRYCNPINYGFVPQLFSGDGEEMDVYLLGVREPVKEYTARIIDVVHRKNDGEDKLIAAPEGMNFTKTEIVQAVEFQEQYFDGEIETIFEKSLKI